MTVEQGDITAYNQGPESKIEVFEAPLVPLTPETIKPYGRLISYDEELSAEVLPWPTSGWRPLDKGTGTGGGTVSGRFWLYRNGDFCEGQNESVAGRGTSGAYLTGTYKDSKTGEYNGAYINTREANYHEDSEQAFRSRKKCPSDKNGQPFVLLLALPGDNVKPDNFVAFYCDGSVGVCIKPKIWHQPPFPVGDRAEFENMQGAVHSCISVDFVKEFNTLIRVPLQFPKEFSLEQETRLIEQFLDSTNEQNVISKFLEGAVQKRALRR